MKQNLMLNYKVFYSARRSIGINVSPDRGVTVRAPYGTSMRTIERIVESKSDWIRKHLEKNKNIKRLNGNSSLHDGSIIFYRGKEYTLRLKKASDNKIVVTDAVIELSTLYPEDANIIRNIIRKWYISEASEHFSVRLKELLDKYQGYRFSPTALVIKTMKRRWGSCSSQGRITLNSELIKLDDIFTEYVILHELCHLYHPNHGKEFYRLLGEVYPGWKTVRKELGKYLS